MTCKDRTKMLAALAATSMIASVATAPAQAQTEVTFEGTVVASCVLSVTTPGVLAISTGGTELSTEQTGGAAAVLGITATGGAPTVKFTAPSMAAKPTAYTALPTVSLKYTSTAGANQPWTTGASQYTSTNPLGDTVTLHAKAVDSNGFAAGSYRLQTTATCQQ